jgi:hypothetical protein
MSITSLPSASANSPNVDSLKDMAQALMKRFDKDQDGRLSINEFAGLLTQLLSSSSTPTPGTPNPLAAPTGTANATGPTHYSLGIGFVPEKLNDPTYYSDKYSHALKDQFLPAMEGLSPTSESLQTIVDRINAKGGQAKLIGKDNIDFGDGKGPIDCIVDVGGVDARWGFQNT